MTRDCPACVARPLLALSASPSGPKMIWRCMRCHGAWVSLGEFGKLRGSFGADHPVLDERLPRPRCRICGHGLALGQTGCNEKHDQAIGCVSCGQKMEMIRIGDIVIDVCLLCRAAWFDEGELGAMVRRHAQPVRRHAKSVRHPDPAGPQPSLASDVVDAGSDVLGALEVVASVPIVALDVIDVAAAAGEAATGAVEGVFGVLEGVLGIFDGL